MKSAQDGEQAIEIAAAWRPEFVLIDVNLPKGDGFAVAERLRRLEHGQAMTLVMMTGEHVDGELEQRAKARGCDHCFDKITALSELEPLLRHGG